MLELYKTLVRPYLENIAQVRLHCYRNNVIKMERVQSRITRMLPGYKGLSYGVEMGRLGVYSFKSRRLKGDIIEVYKTIRGIDRVNAHNSFPRVGE